MSNRALLSASLLIVLLLSLASCRAPNPAPVATPPLNEGTPAPTPAPTKELSEVSPTEANPVPVETQAPSRQVGEGSAVIAFNQEFDQLNPLFAQALSAQMIYNVWNCQPWNFDDQNNPLPVLVQEIPSAENGGLSQDGRSITMKLRDDIVWSDGEPITSDDFVFTYQMITNPNNNVLDSSAYNGVESVTAPDPQTVVVQYKERNVSWIYALWHVLLPKHVLEPVFNDQGTLENAEWNKAPTVGCGPFVFDKWEAGQSVTFKTNEKYWLDLPHLGSILVKFYPDDASKAQAIISGDADLSVFLIDGATQIPIMQDAGMQILPVDSGYREGIFFFLDPTKGNPALQDVKVRQAIAMGIDRAAIITSLYKGVVQPAISYWDNTPYIDPSLKPWPYDPEKAKSLLEQAGWTDSNGNGLLDKDGLELKLSYGTTTSPLRQAVQAEIQKQLQQIGVGVELLNYDPDTFFAGADTGGPAATGQLDLFEYSAATADFPDPATEDFLCAQIPSAENAQGLNWSYICDPELDQLFATQATQTNPQERQQTFHTISKIIFDKVYFLGLWTDPDFWAANPRLLNVKISGVTPFYNIQDWDLQP